MRDLYRNPMLYYVLIPVMIGMWPLLVWAVYLPAAERACEGDYSLLIEGQTNIIGILEIDPDITRGVDPNRVGGEFDYGSAIDRVANTCGIPAGNHSFSAGSPIVSGGKKRQDAQVKLDAVSIVQIARFLSTIQATWVDLSCETMKLRKVKAMPDQWDVDFRFMYYY